jgi:plastocyanin
MRIRGQLRRSRRHFLLLLAALLGAAVVILPAVASSETSPTIEAYNVGPYYHWNPAAATINGGAAVTFTNPSSEVKHGVEWRPGNPTTPSCSAGVPVGTNSGASGTKWTGTCTFTTPGTYTFYCTVHGSEMTGSITVNANGTTTTTTTSTGTGTQTTTAGGGYSTTTATPTGSSSQGGSGSPLAGSAAQAVKLASNQHGKSVRGSVAISPAGTGGRLEVDLLARTASLASAGQASQVRVGRVVRSSLQAGKVSFSVPLNARARRALRRHGRLALSVKVLVTRLGGSAVTTTRRVVVHS